RTDGQSLEPRLKLVYLSVEPQCCETGMTAHLHAIPVKVEPDRQVPLDLSPDLRKIIGQVRSAQIQLDSNHAAANVNADCCGDDGGLRWNNAAYSRAFTQMDVGHDRDMPGDHRKIRDIAD